MTKQGQNRRPLPRPLPTTSFLLLATAAISALSLTAFVVTAQVPVTEPPTGIREKTPRHWALLNAKIVVSPTVTIEKGTVVFNNGIITAIGADITPPADARTIDCTGKTIYAGFIDASSEGSDAAPDTAATPAGRRARGATPSVPPSPTIGGAGYWNTNITPQFKTSRSYAADAEAAKTLRSQGITTRLLVPPPGLIRGTSVLVHNNGAAAKDAIISDDIAEHVTLTVPRRRGGGGGGGGDVSSYPDSPMGALTLVRQAIYDARWYSQAQKAISIAPALPRIERNDALDALASALTTKLPLIVDAPDELYVLRADRLGKEFDAPIIVNGSGQEFRLLQQIVDTGHPIILPVNFPKPPDVASPEAAIAISLQDLMEWDLAPENPARLEKAGIKIAFSTKGLRRKADFLSKVRQAVSRGLPQPAALAALTTTPAKLFRVDQTLGTVEVGKFASLIVADGDIFADKTAVTETWVRGDRFDPTTATTAPSIAATMPATEKPQADPRGTYTLTTNRPDGTPATYTLRVAGDHAKTGDVWRLTTTLHPPHSPASQPPTSQPTTTQPASAPSTRPSADGKTVSFNGSGLTFTAKVTELGSPGIAQFSLTLVGDDLTGLVAWPDGTVSPATAALTTPDKDDDTPQNTRVRGGGGRRGGGGGMGAGGGKGGGFGMRADTSADGAATRPSTRPASFEPNYPLGEYGRNSLPEQPPAVLFTNATVWTNATETAPLEKASVLVLKGKIAAVLAAGAATPALPEGTVTIDLAGRHLTPGVIDCHSHMATDGGVNESGQTITAEVRIGDFIDPSDITIYRQLAGGVTSANILHGSANTIGGQNQVIKLRWGSGPEEMKFENAMPGIKFALGENPKQSNWGDNNTTRYPQTRMGVEQLVRDEFTAANEYLAAWKAYTADPSGKIPPRVDLELQAVGQILTHDRIIHCHSYRQDEILALIRTCDDFGVTIGSLQHILEGYKVADAIKKHGATASTFSDWWAYKAEVMDAIPYNGAIMQKLGIVVSFNSDDGELGRRLNSEAGKAVKYGGVPPAEALKFVTLNPARQLHIDNRVGSLEVGKDADIAIWSGDPLSVTSRCEQTWIDGRKYFDLTADLEARKLLQARKATLIQKILDSGEASATDESEAPGNRVLWPNEDEYCGHSHAH